MSTECLSGRDRIYVIRRFRHYRSNCHFPLKVSMCSFLFERRALFEKRLFLPEALTPVLLCVLYSKYTCRKVVTKSLNSRTSSCVPNSLLNFDLHTPVLIYKSFDTTNIHLSPSLSSTAHLRSHEILIVFVISQHVRLTSIPSQGYSAVPFWTTTWGHHFDIWVVDSIQGHIRCVTTCRGIQIDEEDNECVEQERKAVENIRVSDQLHQLEESSRLTLWWWGCMWRDPFGYRVHMLVLHP